MMDWIPMVGYGDAIVVGAATTAYVILYPLPNYSGSGEEFLFEDEDSVGLYLERIVGEVHVAAAGGDGARVAWQLMPLGVDYELGAVLEPFSTPWGYRSSEWANLRMWDRRVLDYTNTSVPQAVDHPYWTHVDINPRQLMGARRNLWPVLAVEVVNAGVDCRLTHTLRALWK